jgi:hypothetical protein
MDHSRYIRQCGKVHGIILVWTLVTDIFLSPGAGRPHHSWTQSNNLLTYTRWSVLLIIPWLKWATTYTQLYKCQWNNSYQCSYHNNTTDLTTLTDITTMIHAKLVIHTTTPLYLANINDHTKWLPHSWKKTPRTPWVTFLIHN